MQTVQNGVNRLRNYLLSLNWVNTRLLPSLPRSVRWGLRRLYFLPFDLMDSLNGQRNKMMPPRSANFTGAVDDFISSAQRQVRRLVYLAKLTPHSRVLDIGCGMGRLATALIDYLEADGRYDGFDIVPSGIKWAQDHIAAGHPNIHFVLSDIYNKEYNPTGKLKATEYRFPYDDQSFDVIVLTSVFTHLLPDDFEHYMTEISRVLKPGGYCYATFSLVNDEVKTLMAEGRAEMVLRPMLPSAHWATGEKVQELATGYEETYVRDMYARHKMAGNFKIYYGTWPGRTLPPDQTLSISPDGHPDTTTQDVIVSARQ